MPALLEAYDIPYVFSDPLTLALTLDKAMTKRVVRDAGVPTADFAVIESEADIAKVALPFPLFLKPVAEGSGKGVDGRSQGGRSRPSLARVARDLLARFRQPVLVEEFLPGREFTVGITGTGEGRPGAGRERNRAAGRNIIGHGYGYENKETWEDKLTSCWPKTLRREAAGEVALAAWRVLRCRDGGRADVRLDRHGQPRFIEVNPLAGIRPGYSDLCFIAEFEGLSYQELIGKFLDAFLAAPSGFEMKILVLHSDVAADAPPEDQDTLIAAEAVAAALRRKGHAVARRRFPRRYHLPPCWNGKTPIWCSIWWKAWTARASLAPAAPRLLAEMGMPFTGASAEAMDITYDKPKTKAELRDAGLATPGLEHCRQIGPASTAGPSSSRRRWKTAPSGWMIIAWSAARRRSKPARKNAPPLRRRLVCRGICRRPGIQSSAAGQCRKPSHPADGGNDV